MAKQPNFLFPTISRGGCFAFPEKDKGMLIIYTLNPDTVENFYCFYFTFRLFAQK